MPRLCKSSLMNHTRLQGSLNCRLLFAITVGYGLYKASNGSRAEEKYEQHETIKTAETVVQMVD
jgi:hypothetical protein